MVAALVRLVSIFCFLLGFFGPNVSYALPITLSTPYLQLLPRAKFVINNATGTPEIFSPTTQQAIPQGPATDGSGTGFDISAIIWLVFCFVVGLPMAFAGIRLWRLTTGVGIGLSTAVCSWAALNNAVNQNGIADLILIAIVLGMFVLGFILGVFEFGRITGMTLLAITGGLAFGIRIIIIKDGLLISGLSLLPVNWVVVAIIGALSGAMMVPHNLRRAGILLGSASVGTFFVCLGIDLIINRQSGMSRGLRFLFDRNSNHALDIVVGGYHPTISTQILLAVSLGLTPVLAVAQHRIFKAPFSRKERPDSAALNVPIEEKSTNSRPPTFFLNLWDGAKLKSPSRFSL